ncbi:transcription factor 24-like [Poeciliopsis prolifica]|uniref:transcription factor 24-like n=1 Tax=Poeciliopsis prolifica TaxID=188132 RepID=UPI002413C3B0|nr:transcription factor 24-like [Poeciliopsis prolifica]
MNFPHSSLLRSKANLNPANENTPSHGDLSPPNVLGVCCGSPAEPMAVNPLEGLMSVTVNQQLVHQSPAAAADHPAAPQGHRESATSSRQEPRKWEQTVCGSRFSSAPACGPVVQSRPPRAQHSPENAARERSRVRNLRQAFHSLQAALPSVPPDTKLSKLDVLVLATNYIAYLTETLDQDGAVAEHAAPSRPGGYLHPVKKWPMRSLLYCGTVGDLLSANQRPRHGHDPAQPLTPDEQR